MGKPLKPQTHCKRGHEFTPANTIRRTDGTRLCRECEEVRRRAYLRRKGIRSQPSESGKCYKGLHPWVPENLYFSPDGHARCIQCRRIAARALWHRNHVWCIVKGCQRMTARQAGGTYICPTHRAQPPAWLASRIARREVRIVGTEVLAA